MSLTKDVPLVFNEGKYRDGLAGEVFTVVQYRPDIRRVFVLLRDSAGKPFAVSVDDSAVALAPKDHYTALTRGISQVALGDLQTAVQSFEEADRFDGAVSVATGLKTLARTFAVRLDELTKARAAEAQYQPDLQRRLRNARVAARANPLFPGNENKQRGAAIEEEAKQLAAQHRMEVEAAEWKAIDALKMGEPVVQKLVTSRCYVAALALDDALCLFARKNGLTLEPFIRPESRAQLSRAIAEADAALQAARVARSSGQLVAAHGHALRACEIEPGRGEARRTRDELAAALASIRKTIAEAERLRAEQSHAAALTLLSAAKTRCTDMDELNALHQSLTTLTSAGSAPAK